MKSHRLGMLLSTLLVVAPFASATQAAVAVLEQLAGHPTIYEVGATGARTVSLPRRGAEYRLPIEIETGPDDSATFRLPDSEVSVAPNSVMRVAAPEANGGGLLQRIFQKAGASLFSVDRRNIEHFQVETPYLVSVVKGTTFNVVVHDEGATVSLYEGRLQVTSVDGSQQVILLPGDVAFSGRDGELHKLEQTMASRERAATGSAQPVAAEDKLEPLTPTLAGAIELDEALTTDLGVVALDDGPGTQAVGLIDDLRGADDLTGDLGQLPADVAGDATGIIGGIGDGADDLVADLGGALDPVTDALDGVEPLVDGVTAPLDDLTGGLVGDLVDPVADTATDLLGDVVDTTGDLSGDLVDSTGDLTGGLADTTADLTGDLTDTTADLTGDLTDITADLTGDLGGTAGDLTGGLTDGGQGLGGALGGGLRL